MRPPVRQLPLDLAQEPAQGREDFLVSASNEAAYALVESWPDWPERRALLVGPPGSGKTHLAAIWAQTAVAAVCDAAALDEADVPGLVEGGALALENAERIGARETALFHLLNLARESGTALLITARDLPGRWGLAIPDLLSRLRALPTVTIAPPDDLLLRSLLVKLFVDRQLVVDTGVIDYLALHIDRSFDAASRAVAGLDREALARGRRITRAMAADVLAAAER
ncbi:hypothetical protein [Labrys wisconsinensis]|uniref:Chromosomal replication initiation ATPase DnaA n=1 Tax=Labrys wisconsinensis TaxID=425677 RepID=A0ABU0J481_9HYPH|nr:hypothetical protein [Labrys wisconsinensis]MDQ0468346.1 chromosomal replication initiation ATPase DnaA [Labrys wisconsinensis]